MNLTVKHFSELTVSELYDILKLRVSVFVLEQSCLYKELDDMDKNAFHLWYSDKDGVAAYLRVLPDSVWGEVSIGRVISVRRRMGIGSMILEEVIKKAKER